MESFNSQKNCSEKSYSVFIILFFTLKRCVKAFIRTWKQLRYICNYRLTIFRPVQTRRRQVPSYLPTEILFSQHIVGTSSSSYNWRNLSLIVRFICKYQLLALFLLKLPGETEETTEREQSERMSEPRVLTSRGTKSFGERDREARRFDRHDYSDR